MFFFLLVFALGFVLGSFEGGERGGRILFPLLTYSIYTDVSSGRI